MAQQVILASKESELVSMPKAIGSPAQADKSVSGETGVDNAMPLSGKEKGVFARARAGYALWRYHQREIPLLMAAAEKNRLWIEAALDDYRLTISELSYKLEKVDEQVWEQYRHLTEQFPRLQKETRRRPLALRSPDTLQSLHDRWKELIQDQEQELDLLSRAPESLRAFNTAQLLHRQMAEERARRAENIRRISQAREGLEKALVELSNQDMDLEPITLGSKILRLEDAQKVWKLKLDEIRASERSDNVNPDEVLVLIHKLNQTVQDAPISARWIRALEAKFSKLVAQHDLLTSLGRTVIPQSELARATMILYETVPRLWLNAENEELDRHLQLLEKFITFNEDAVKRELDLAERRRPGITQALSMSLPGQSDGLSSVLLLARSMVSAIDARDRFMRGHSEEVTRLALRTARKLNWSATDLEFLELAGLLHDVGKLSIPEAVLSKVSPLTSEERSIIEKHPLYGANIIKPVRELNRIVPWIYHHQERWDGSGYPDRLSRKDIPLAASIISIAEAYTVMTTDLPYRTALLKPEALENIRKEAGHQFNPEVVEAFIEGVNEPTSDLGLLTSDTAA